MSTTLRGEVDFIRDTTTRLLTLNPAAANTKISESFYDGPQGEEKVQKTYNYNFAGLVIKPPPDFNSHTNDALESSVTARDQDGTTKISETFYEGPEGEEKSTLTHNYNYLGSTVKSSTIFDYDTTDALEMSTTLRGEVDFIRDTTTRLLTLNPAAANTKISRSEERRV